MGTLPEYHGLGLAMALIFEGFRRLAVHKPTLIYRGGAADTPAANRLYDETGFTTKWVYHMWRRSAQH